MISDNSGSRRGCGIYGGTAINCIISGNSTPIEGGGIYHGTAYHCVFTGNEAHAAGGGMFEATAINCIFIGNRADSGGGMYNSTAINCTIIGNEADLNGGGLVGGTATNCIIYYNQAGGTGNDTYSVSPRFSCASDLPHGSYGNITNAPLFADRFDKNFRLTDQSPCVNAGTTSAVAVVSDLDGLPRIVDYVVDLGAYEYQEILDSDGDLISDGYEVCYFGGKTNAEASADNDDDGQNNRDEYIAGMNPFDSGSLFMITNFFSTPEGALIEWPAAYGRRYQVLFSTNLLQAFQLLEDDISYPGHSCIDTVNTNGTCFYRVNVRLLE